MSLPTASMARPAAEALAEPNRYIYIVLDGPPGPEAGRFVEVDDERGNSIAIGKWIDLPQGLCALELPDPRVTEPVSTLLTACRNALRDWPVEYVEGNPARPLLTQVDKNRIEELRAAIKLAESFWDA